MCPLEPNLSPPMPDISRPKIILLNGVGSVGKSSTAKALQRVTTRPFLHVAMDAFLDMLPERAHNHTDGLAFIPVRDADPPLVMVRAGPIVERALSGMRRAIAAMAARGNDLIVDDVMLSDAAEAEYRALLAPFDFRMVGLFAPLAVIEARKKARGDRHLGLARGQIDIVHRNRNYDLTIDTAAATPAEIAARIKRAFDV
jgi:chloramphenicol 3-O phosphotransferase